MTSRPHGYQSNPIAGVTTLEIRPYDNRQQAQFVRNWYLANEVMSRGGKEDAGVRMKAKEGADDLLRRLGDSPNLAELAVNPLLLTMIATVHRFRSALPKRRVELYDEIFSVFLGTWRGARGIEQELTPDQRKQVLQPLAWTMMEQKVRQISTNDGQKIIEKPLRRVDREMAPLYFLEIVRNQSGLLVERENGFLAFAHLTFQEYLAAIHLQGDETRLDPILKKVQESWWHETLLLYAAKQDATSIIKACIDTDKELLPDTEEARTKAATGKDTELLVSKRMLPSTLVLALDCEEEALQVAQETRKQLNEVVTKAVTGENIELRRIVGEAWLNRRLKHLVRLSEDIYIDSTLVSHAEYQIFLDEKREKGGYYQPDHWSDNQFPREMGQLPIVGVRPGDAIVFCEWLSNRTEEKFNFRLPNKREVNIIKVDFGPNGYWILEDSQTTMEMPRAIPHISIAILQKYNSYAQDYIHHLDLDYALDNLEHIFSIHNYALGDLDQLFKNLDDALDRVLGLSSVNLTRYLANARDQARDYARNYARNLGLDHTLAHNQIDGIRHSFVLALARGTVDHEHSYDLYRLLGNLSHALSQDLNHALEHASALVDALETEYVQDLVDAYKLSYKLTQDIKHALNHAHDRTNECSELRKVLYLIGILIEKIRQERFRTTSLLQRRSNQWRQDQQFLEQLTTNYFSAFIDLCVLEERIKGNLPAFEGIRLIRERIKKN